MTRRRTDRQQLSGAAAIVGIAGPTLSPEEAALFRAHPPSGVILFARNIQDPAQLARLIAALRRAPAARRGVDGRSGGRSRRPSSATPLARASARRNARRLFARDPAAALRAAWLTGALIGLDCAAAGFTVAATPVLDLSIPGAHDVIGDRALAAKLPLSVARLGRTLAGGPAGGRHPAGGQARAGHGRARVDSHLALPRVAGERISPPICCPFALNTDLPWMMTAHIVYRRVRPHSPRHIVAGGDRRRSSAGGSALKEFW